MKASLWVELLIFFFFPMTPGGHPLGITGKKRSQGISIFEMPTLCRGKTIMGHHNSVPSNNITKICPGLCGVFEFFLGLCDPF
jgi:hypothetical protein